MNNWFDNRTRGFPAAQGRQSVGEEGWGRARASCPEEVAEELACKLSTISTQIKDNFYFINAVKLHYCLNIITLPTLKRRQGREGERIRKSKRYRERRMRRAGESARERRKWNGGSKRACLKDVMNCSSWKEWNQSSTWFGSHWYGISNFFETAEKTVLLWKDSCRAWNCLHI